MATHQNLPSSPDVPHWHAGYNQPGYLPEAEPDVHASCHAARDALADDMEAHAAATETWADPHNCDDIPCPTYGDDCPWQTAGNVRAERDDLLASDGPEWSGQAGGLAYWVTECVDAACVADLAARIAADHTDEGTALAAFAASGTIGADTAEEADRQRQAAADEHAELDLLCAYLAAVGPREAAADWPSR